jgi:hypothetical protein
MRWERLEGEAWHQDEDISITIHRRKFTIEV